jgi:hypothetical protein
MSTNTQKSQTESSAPTSAWWGREANRFSSLAGEFHRISQAASSSKVDSQGIAQARSVSRQHERQEMILDAKRAQFRKMQQLSHTRFIRFFISRAYLDELAQEIQLYEKTYFNWQHSSPVNPASVLTKNGDLFQEQGKSGTIRSGPRR